MKAMNEFLVDIKDGDYEGGLKGQRRWPPGLKAKVVADTLVAGATVKGVAAHYGIAPSHLSDWRRLAREGKLVLPTLSGADFVPLCVEAPSLAPSLPTVSKPQEDFAVLELVKGDITIRFPGNTSAAQIGEIARAL